MNVIVVGDRSICISGIGKMFYQDGFPIEISVAHLKDKGIEVSLFHVADELLKNGWNAKSVISRFSEEFGEHKKDIEAFCLATYEEQRKIIYEYLYPSDTIAKNWFRCNL